MINKYAHILVLKKHRLKQVEIQLKSQRKSQASNVYH